MRGADDSMFRNTVSLNMTKDGDESSAIDVWPDHSVDSPSEGDQNRKSV